jgi:hypothetical protein
MRKYYFLLGIASIVVCVLYWVSTDSSNADFHDLTGYTVNSKMNVQIEHTVQKLPDKNDSAVKTEMFEEPKDNHMINNISLYSDKEDVLKELGNPIEITEHEYFIDYEEYRYERMTISFVEGQIQNIAIPATEKEFKMGNRILSTDPKLMDELFGPPELKSEDGILYSKDDIYIKIFYELGTTDMDSIHFFTEGI